MSVLLANAIRGSVVESRHRGYVVAANGSGKILASTGDTGFVTYMRSAAKPLQAINVILSGAADKFQFTQKETAITCSSHFGLDMHREVVYGILKKIGCSTADLLCGTPLSINVPYMQRQLRENLVLDEANSDCSGKHSGFLSVCRARGYSTEGYNRPEHPMQREVLDILAYMTGMPAEEIPMGTDGCGVPVHALPMLRMAMAYARFSTPEQVEEPYRSACQRLYAAMTACPEMIAGPGGFCTELMKATGGKLCGKVGAEAVYCIGVKGRDLGIAVKIEDGNFRALYPVVVSVLRQLELLDDGELERLQSFAAPRILNDLGWEVGEVQPCFQLSF